MTNVLLVTPTFSNTVHAPYATSLAKTAGILSAAGIELHTRLSVTGSLLISARNALINNFLEEKEFSHVLCVDSDLGWNPDAVLKMLEFDEEFVAGVYPMKESSTFLFRPCLKENGSLMTLEKGLIKMNYIPAGFMLIKRSVFEKIIQKFPELKYKPKDPKGGPGGYAFFNTELYDGEFWGEDYVFCRKAREAGVDIWVDPTVQFWHGGREGCLMSILSNEKPQKKEG